ncbi:MAG: malonyl-CoA synthase [Rhodospirillaceae bacterium]|nr:malonyl-CoA synthase [Rhodospirillaceae bacterium]
MVISGSLFERIAARQSRDPHRVILERADAHPLTWSDMEEATARLSRLMSVTLGLKPGDRVAVRVEKSTASLLLYLACLRAGLVYVPMNTAYGRDEVDYLIGNAAPELVVCDPAARNEVRDLAIKHSTPHVRTLNADGKGSLWDATEGTPANFPTVACASDAPAAMLYTSGTTGRPKGAVLSHGNLIANAEDLISVWKFTADDVLLHALPLFHAHGLFVACHCALLSGARLIWHPRFDASLVLGDLPRATVFMGVPTFYTRLLADARLDRALTGDMRVFISGSAPLLAETWNSFATRTGHRIVERYGMTETGMNTSNPVDGARKPGSVGLPLPSTELRIVGEDGGVLPTDQIGDVQVRGANVFSGYWRMPDKTAEDFTEDGWFKTGDVGFIDPDGYVHLVGRAKDLIISGGYNVYPKEVEAVIDRLDGVVESAVIGVPHPDFGEAVTAVVVRAPGATTPDAEGVIGAVRDAIANYKVPKSVHFVTELPRNTMGKVQKNLLRDTYG